MIVLFKEFGTTSMDFELHFWLCHPTSRAEVADHQKGFRWVPAAELRPLGLRFPRQAEAAISVEKPWQSHGVGSALLRHTLLTARNRGVRLLHMACLAENRRMQELARKFDAELSFDFGSVIGEVESSRPTPLSLMREVMADGHGFATAMLDLQTKMLRA